jgi:predicted ATPase/DNA-binding CsgD family transcriptional regulator
MGMTGETPIDTSEKLTRRELDILAHLKNGKSSQEIAELESLAYTSVKWYIHQIYTKLGVSSRAEAILRARDLGLFEREAVPAPAAPSSNLPRQLTSFIGRADEIATLLGQVSMLPLVTLTGSGGTGKTRLALQVGLQAVETFADGVWLVSLAQLDDPDLVPQVAASTLGLRDLSRDTTIPILCQFIGAKHLLLILDNCEHLIGAAADLAYALLQACPRLHILATSRELLGVAGEKAHRCPPLSLPDSQAHPSFAELTQFEALRLFYERGQSASAAFTPSAANALQVAHICQRLDGIPLAIELAAARLRILSLEQIAARLDNVFHLLTGGVRAALPRHQTLKALIDWSYDLLSPTEQQLLCRLSVFVGNWTLEAAEAVGSCPPCGAAIPPEEIIGLLGQLADKSLIERIAVPEGSAAQPRYRILEMIRQYAQHRLEETGGVAVLRERHLDYYRELALRAEAELRSKTGRQWVERLEDELPNLRGAMEHALSGSVVKGLHLAAGLYWFWFMTSHRLEGHEWLDALLAAEEAGRAARADEGAALIERKLARGKALNTSVYMGILVGRDGTQQIAESVAIFESLNGLFPEDAAYARFLQGGRTLEEYLEEARAIGCQWLMGEILFQQALRAHWAGELAQAKRIVQEGLLVRNAISDYTGRGGFLWTLGTLHFMENDLAAAEELYEAGRRSHWEGGDMELYVFSLHLPAWLALAQGRYIESIRLSQSQLEQGLAMNVLWVSSDAYGGLAWAALLMGDAAKAEAYGREALKLRGRVGENFLSVARYVLSRLLMQRGELAEARAHLCEFVAHNYHSWPPVQLGIQLFGMLALAEAQPARAATLFGAQAAISDKLMNVIPLPERQAYQEALSAVRSQLSAEELAAAWEQGAAMTTREAIAYATG